jgi:peptidoglycan/xylan/chitin deacetylase (PgdA/CDA1 family)
MYADGHQVCSHTWSHANLDTLTSYERKNEMWKNEMALRNILGVIPTYMRPPYSACTASTGCEADMAALGYHITYFVRLPFSVPRIMSERRDAYKKEKEQD